MIIPIRTDSPLQSTPWTNWALIAANVICFLLQRKLLEYLDGHDVSLSLESTNPALLSYFTYPFLHRDWIHLIFNMLFLYIFGNNVNDKMGSVGYLGFYLAGGVFSGIGHVLTSTSGVIGASGAVSAVTGAYLVLFPRSHVTVIFFFILIGQFAVPSMYFIIFFFIKDLIPVFSGSQGDVAHVAHIAGTLFGVGVCMALLSVNLLPRDQYDVMSMLRQWNRRRQYQNLVRNGYDPFAYAPPRSPKPDVRQPAPPPPPDPILIQIQDLRAEISESIAHHNLPHAAMQFLKLKKLDPRQILSRQAQLDVANQLASQQQYDDAVEAYEQFLEHYPNFEQIEQVQLMLGIIYARYLNRADRARELLLRALARLHGEREINMARSELERLAPSTPR